MVLIVELLPGVLLEQVPQSTGAQNLPGAVIAPSRDTRTHPASKVRRLANACYHDMPPDADREQQ